MRSLILSMTIFLIVIIGLGVSVDAQNRKCRVTVTPRADAGGAYFEISGERFGVGQELRLEALNRRTGQGLIFFHTPEEKSFSGVFIGKDPDGFLYRVSPGFWTVTAKSETCTAKTEFAVSGVPTGNWGGEQVQLSVSQDGARFTFACSFGVITEPLAPDVNGNFEVKGALTTVPPVPGIPASTAEVVFRIWTDGNVMRVNISVPGQPPQPGGFDLTFGRATQIIPCA
ncbi:MAG TPA: hypothetical protein VKA70_19720 [Blastocatellia bacterium]|nr:hypothetical protein [Blastocatellia bacterium]